jgi:hypothetical protein
MWKKGLLCVLFTSSIPYISGGTTRILTPDPLDTTISPDKSPDSHKRPRDVRMLSPERSPIFIHRYSRSPDMLRRYDSPMKLRSPDLRMRSLEGIGSLPQLKEGSVESVEGDFETPKPSPEREEASSERVSSSNSLEDSPPQDGGLRLLPPPKKSSPPRLPFAREVSPLRTSQAAAGGSESGPEVESTHTSDVESSFEIISGKLSEEDTISVRSTDDDSHSKTLSEDSASLGPPAPSGLVRAHLKAASDDITTPASAVSKPRIGWTESQSLTTLDRVGFGSKRGKRPNLATVHRDSKGSREIEDRRASEPLDVGSRGRGDSGSPGKPDLESIISPTLKKAEKRENKPMAAKEQSLDEDDLFEMLEGHDAENPPLGGGKKPTAEDSPRATEEPPGHSTMEPPPEETPGSGRSTVEPPPEEPPGHSTVDPPGHSTVEPPLVEPPGHSTVEPPLVEPPGHSTVDPPPVEPPGHSTVEPPLQEPLKHTVEPSLHPTEEPQKQITEDPHVPAPKSIQEVLSQTGGDMAQSMVEVEETSGGVGGGREGEEQEGGAGSVQGEGMDLTDGSAVEHQGLHTIQDPSADQPAAGSTEDKTGRVSTKDQLPNTTEESESPAEKSLSEPLPVEPEPLPVDPPPESVSSSEVSQHLPVDPPEVTASSAAQGVTGDELADTQQHTVLVEVEPSADEQAESCDQPAGSHDKQIESCDQPAEPHDQPAGSRDQSDEELFDAIDIDVPLTLPEGESQDRDSLCDQSESEEVRGDGGDLSDASESRGQLKKQVSEGAESTEQPSDDLVQGEDGEEG